MGPNASATASRETEPIDEALLIDFTKLLRSRYPHARVYLFGSRARGTPERYSDYDLIIVSQGFTGQRRLTRPVPLYALWRQAGGGGFRHAVDLHCYTPTEFRRNLRGLGFIGQAKRRGELRVVTARGVAPRASGETQEG